MSHKIKILAEDQYSQLLSAKSKIGEENISLFMSSLLPNLFYSASDKILNSEKIRYLYIPGENWTTQYSTGFFNNRSFRRFELAPKEIAVENNLFIPIQADNLIIGGFLGNPQDIVKYNRDRFLKDYNLDEYLFHLSEIGEQTRGTESPVSDLLDMISSEKSIDSFMCLLPEWIVETIGGGSAAFYHGNGDTFVLRKEAGGIDEFETTPPVLEGEDALTYAQLINEDILFSPLTVIPEYTTILNYAPLVRFAIGGNVDKNFEYLITGQIPDITSFESSRFFKELKKILTKLSFRHFSSISNWRQLLTSLEKMTDTKCSEQNLAEYLYTQLSESIIINHLSICQFYPLENRIQVVGLASSRGKSPLQRDIIFPVTGTWYETVIDSGQPRFDELHLSDLDNKIANQLFKESVRSNLIIPMQTGNTICGFLNIGSPMTGNYLKEYQAEFDAIARFLSGLHERLMNRHKIELLSDQLEQLHNKFSSIENIRTLGELAGGVFHDLNNIIGAILGRSQLILQKTESKAGDELIDKIIKDARLIEISALDSAEILKRLKQLAKSNKKGNKEPIDLQALIDDSIEMIQPRWERLVQSVGLNITLEKEPVENIMILAEPSELREVFTNLLLNALDAMPDGGRISIIGRRIDRAVQITVSDTGTGMSPELLEKVFTPFFTTKGEKGTGLGLPLCKKIIEDHNGSLTVNSVVGEGTSFIIMLPIIETADSDKNLQKASNKDNLNLNILIAEDSIDLQDTIYELLISRGYKVSKASSGEEVLKLCGRERFNLLITDLGLPGISGLELARHIKSIDKNIKIILTSGWDIKESASELRESGVDSYLPKPFRTSDIQDAIVNLFEI